ncbi:MAG TPA: ShlB/FhaC/HecB family hemolysin secretion/activation protein [Phenylobacterium sp.]|nr:ShlB/FhaC/HecB family hemolysin secretion/activation protein [Phenylobacterium sp.]
MRSHAPLALVLAALMLGLAGEARADQASQPPAPRTGPAAAGPALPDYPQAPRPLLAPPAAAPALPQAAGTVLLTDVHVRVEPADGAAAPTADWRPVADPATGLALRLDPAERFDAAWVRRQFAENGLIGARVPMDRVVALVQLINLAFARNGYLNSGVLVAPQASPDGGVLELRLVLGGLRPQPGEADGLVVAWGPGGRAGLTEGYVRRRMPAAEAVPLNALALERDFRLLAADPAIRTVNADLRPGERPGEAQLLLTVQPQRRYDLYASFANDRSPAVGGERAAVGGSFRNLLVPGDLISAEVGVTSDRGDVVASYETPFLRPDLTLRVRGGHNEAAVVDSVLRPLDISSKDWSLEGGLDYTLVDRPLTPVANGAPIPARTLTVGVRAAHRESRTYLLGEPFSFSPGFVNGRSEYTAARLTADWVERGVDRVWAVSLTGTLGLDGTRSDVVGVPSPSENFKVVLAQLSYARRLTEGGLELRGRLAGQWSDGVLYSGERFSVGGEDTVRGYRENLLLADQGALASLELALPLAFGEARARDFDWSAFTVSAFAEGATVKNHDGATQPAVRSLASVGVGLTWTPSEAIFARLSLAEGLKDVPRVGSRDLQDRGVHFRVVVRPLLLGGAFSRR